MTVRLLGVLSSEWEFFDGYALSRGIGDLRHLPLSRVVNLVWYTLVKDAEQEDKDKLKANLWMPPKGMAVTDSRSPWSPEQENAAFSSLQATLGLSDV